jgi:hypothetical protein
MPASNGAQAASSSPMRARVLGRPMLFHARPVLFLYVSCEVGVWNWLPRHLIAQGIPESRALNILSLGFALGLLIGRVGVSPILISVRQSYVTLAASVAMAITTFLMLRTSKPTGLHWRSSSSPASPWPPSFPPPSPSSADAFPRMTGTAIGICHHLRMGRHRDAGRNRLRASLGRYRSLRRQERRRVGFRAGQVASQMECRRRRYDREPRRLAWATSKPNASSRTTSFTSSGRFRRTSPAADQARGNSGVFLASTGPGDDGYELQILDSYNNKTYVNGQAGSMYKQAIPLANPNRKPGEWQTYDVVWTAPTFNDDGSVKTPAYVTVFSTACWCRITLS